jgi:hypothetical protein
MHGDGEGRCNTASFLPSFTRQDAEESEAGICPPGTKSKRVGGQEPRPLDQRTPDVPVRGVGRRFVRVYVRQYHKVPKSQPIPDLNITFQVPNRS